MVENLTLPTSTTDSLQTTTLDITFKICPLTALSKQTLRKLSNFLNTKKIFHTDEGYERDWRGLATLAEQRNLLDENAISGDDPTLKVIQLWCENNADTATFENLEIFLGKIDRWHVIEDIEDDLLKDLKDYQIKQQQEVEGESVKNPNEDSHHENDSKNILVVPTPPSTPNAENISMSAFDHLNLPPSIINNTLSNNAPPLPSCNPLNDFAVTTSSTYGGDSNFLTSEDVRRTKRGLPLQHYDALVLYADADYDYAREILTKLQHNFNFCLKEHLLYGIQFEHEALMTLIRERCTFLIVILTNEFNKSPENRFFLNYAQFLQIQTARRKILPLRYEMNVQIPANLGMYTAGMAYSQKRKEIFWERLADSLESAKITPQGEVTYPESLGSSNNMPLPSAPLLFNEFRQPPYNPQYQLQNWNSPDFAIETMPSSSSSSSNDRSSTQGRKEAIKCESAPSLQSNLYPNTSELSTDYTRNSTTTLEVTTTSSSSSNSRNSNNTQSNVYPNISDSLNSQRNLLTSTPSSTSTNKTQSAAEANSSSEQKKRKTNKGPSKFFKKIFKKL